VPVRDEVDVFAATVKLTVPVPLPLAPAVTVIHAALLTAVHAQPVVVVTLVLPVPPGATAFSEVGETVNTHGAASCVTVTVWPATVSVPVRELVDVFAATLKLTVPLPLPLAPAVTVIHAALLVAVHAQPVVVVTLVLPVPPAATAFSEVADNVKVQGTPACVTVNVCPATVSVPVRELVEVLAAMLKLTVPLPDPLAPAVTVIHAALLTAVHAQPVVVVTFVPPVPPAAATLEDVADSVNVQGTPACVTVNV
jgi:hypothetical protein